MDCPIHQTALKRGKAEIRYGLRNFGPDGHIEEYCDAKRTLFPFANSWTPGGCVMRIPGPRFEKVIYCKKCREAEQAWLQEQHAQGQ